jgi:hypothetical protein
MLFLHLHLNRLTHRTVSTPFSHIYGDSRPQGVTTDESFGSTNTLLEKIWHPLSIVFTGLELVRYCQLKKFSSFVIFCVKMRIVIFDRLLRHSWHPPLFPTDTHNMDQVWGLVVRGAIDSYRLYVSSLQYLPLLHNFLPSLTLTNL